ncbi:MAG: serine acetyltransferase [Clostridia bacterium]|nr:serine acetyltransferase [Clostridia bacterium]
MNTLALIEKTALSLDADEAADTPDTPGGRDFRAFRERVERYTDLLIEAMFPKYASLSISRKEALAQASVLIRCCAAAVTGDDERAEAVLEAVFEALPAVKRLLLTDLEAAYRGDPAATGLDEIILCYPAFTAISTHRLAHVLYLEGVPLLPRLMSEYAHRLTGIDIHPGATIGEAFFIDHGTGVVIGETTTIGRNVKLYQHVTLGAKSFDVSPDGSLVKGIKRHPNVGDRVVIYSGATVLGGNTHIGNDCIIGGSVFLTHSVEAGKMVVSRAAVTDRPLTRDLAISPVFESAML